MRPGTEHDNELTNNTPHNYPQPIEQKKLTFKQLEEWYLNLESVKCLASYETIKHSIVKFNRVFGQTDINDMKTSQLQDYQARRKKDGKADNTIDHEVGKTKTMVKKAYYDDKVDYIVMKAFERVKKLVRNNSDAEEQGIDS